MPAKRKITPLRAASEIRASGKKQALTVFDIFESWIETIRMTVAMMERDIKQLKERQMEYFDQQRPRQKARKGGM